MEKITKWKEKYWGMQDELLASEQFIENHRKYQDTKLKYVTTMELVPAGQVGYDRRVSLLTNHFDESKYVYKNFRISSSKFNKCINHIILDVGGSKHDKVYSNVFKVLRHIYGIEDETVVPFYFNTEGNYLPILTYFDTRFHLEFTEEGDEDLDELGFYIDLYEREEPCEGKHPSLEYMIMQLLYTGEEQIKNTDVLLRLHFHSVCTHLIFNIPNKKLSEFKLLLDKEDTGLTLEDAEVYDDHYIVSLTRSLKFKDLVKSGINLSGQKSKMSFKFDDDKESVSRVYALGMNVIRVKSGLGGYVFGG